MSFIHRAVSHRWQLARGVAGPPELPREAQATVIPELSPLFGAASEAYSW